MSRVLKILLFVMCSLSLHLIVFFADLSERPAIPYARKVGIGLVQRPSAQFGRVPEKVKRSSDQVESVVAVGKNASVPETVAVAEKVVPVIVKESKPVEKRRRKVISTPFKTSLQTQDVLVAVPEPFAEIEETFSTPSKSPSITEMGPSVINTDSSSSEFPATIETTVLSGPADSSLISVEEGGGTGGQGFQDALVRYDLNPRPQYPEIARRRGLEGTVLLEVLVLADGQVGKTILRQSSGYRSLDRAASIAVRRWQFEPAKSAGLSVASRVVVPIDFVLSSK